MPRDRVIPSRDFLNADRSLRSHIAQHRNRRIVAKLLGRGDVRIVVNHTDGSRVRTEQSAHASPSHHAAPRPADIPEGSDVPHERDVHRRQFFDLH